MRIFLVFDYPVKHDKNHFLEKGLIQKGFAISMYGTENIHLRENKSHLLRNYAYFNVCLKAIFSSKRNDIIVTWYDIQGIYCFILSILTFRRRKILALNILIKEKDSWKNKLTRWIYRKAFLNPRFYTTVTSPMLATLLERIVCTPFNEFSLLPDECGSLMPLQSDFTEGDGSVFCGGSNSRDWELIFLVASEMKSQVFNIVMPESKYQEYKSMISPNCNVYREIPFDAFNDLMRKSSVVALPLTTDSAAGLIVIVTAALMCKPVITTDTLVGSFYIQKGVDGFLFPRSDKQGYIDTIEKLVKDAGLRRSIGEAFKRNILQLCSPDDYLRRVDAILHKMIENK